MGAFIGILFNLMFVDTFGSMTPWVALLAAMVVSAIILNYACGCIDYIPC